MRVIVYAALADSGTGGIQTYLAALIKSLGQLTDGNEEYIILTSRSQGTWVNELLGPNQRVVFSDRTRAGLIRRAFRRLARISSSISEKLPLFASDSFPDYRVCKHADLEKTLPVSSGFIESIGASVIHFPYQCFIVTSLPSIFNPHDLQHLHLPSFFSPDTILWREMLYPFACRVATKVAVAANWTANDLCGRYGISREKVVVIPWGAATASHSAPTDSDVLKVRRQYDLPMEYLYYPAVAWPHKNHARLVNAADLLKKQGTTFSFVFSGASTGLTPSLQKLVTDYNLNSSVRFLGHIPSEDMRSVYKGASAVIVPTLFEAISGPVMEAWQEGVPVACSDIPQLKEQVGDAAYLFDPNSPVAIANAVQIVVRDESIRQSLVKAGNQKLESLQWKTTAIKYRELYRETAAHSGAISNSVSWKL